MFERRVEVVTVHLSDTDIVIIVRALEFRRPLGLPNSLIAGLYQDVRPIEQLGFGRVLGNQALERLLRLIELLLLH